MPEFSISKGTCYVLFVFDVAYALDLAQAATLISEDTRRVEIRHKHRAPKYFEFTSQPLAFRQQMQPIVVGQFATADALEIVLYDLAAIAITYAIDIRGPFQNLLPLSEALYDNESLYHDAKRRVKELFELLQPALTMPYIAPVDEDYVIFEIAACTPQIDLQITLHEERTLLAQVLCAEQATLSEQETLESVSEVISFTSQDAVVVDWNAAIIFDELADDARAVLEFGNLELLELRILDMKLDEALGQAYDILGRQRPGWLWSFGTFEQDLNKIARLQADSAYLFEGINNRLKLLGDQYLARIYRGVTQQFCLGEWDTTLQRKLNTLQDIYEKLSHRLLDKRMEFMEILIVVLFVVSVVLELITALKGE